MNTNNAKTQSLLVTFLACPRKVIQSRCDMGSRASPGMGSVAGRSLYREPPARTVGAPQKGTQLNTPYSPSCSVVLGAFRKLALRAQTVRNASPSDSVACRECSHGEGAEATAKYGSQIKDRDSKNTHSALRTSLSRGFTLIEIVVTIVLVGIVTGIAAMIIMQGAQSYSIEQSRGEAHQQARFALERVAREIRLIRSRTASDITTWNNMTLEYFDINGTQIGFQLSGGNIQRRENGGAWQTLATGISTPGADFFTYFDTTGNPPAGVTSLWKIQVDLIAAQGLETLTLRTTVHPRNF